MAAKREDLRVGRAGLLNRRTDEAGSREYVALSPSAAMTLRRVVATTSCVARAV